MVMSAVRQAPPARHERVTLATIAEALGVSRMTVSNAYNRPEKLSPALRERVFDTAKQLGYSGPDPLAATLRRGRVGALGLLFDDPLQYAFTDPAAVLFFEGIAGVCERERVGLALVPSRFERPAETDLIRTALVDGFIAYCDLADDGRLDVIEERGLPMVIVDGPRRPGSHHVGLDDRGAACAAAQHLIDLGHRRFGVIPFQLAPDNYEGPAGAERQAAIRFHASRERLHGYRNALEAAGIDWSTVPVEERSPHGRDAGRRSAGALLDRAERPTALLAMSDELAIGALQAAEDRGIAVPRELSVVGFDDTPSASHVNPPLTTISQPHQEKGAAAARLLLESTEAGRPVESDLIMPAELVVRASSAPVAPISSRPRGSAR
jgi:DNA-binding LacI/PurR family transcriptional regulator